MRIVALLIALAGCEAPAPPPTRVIRWTHDISVSAFGATDAERAIVADVVTQLDDAVGSELWVSLIEDGLQTADVEVHFAPRKDLQRVAAQNGVDYVRGNDGFVSLESLGGRQPGKGFVFIASEPGELVHQHLVLEELTQSLGPLGDSWELPESIFFGAATTSSSPTHLHPMDIKLLQFLYRELQPGDTLDHVNELVGPRWDATDDALAPDARNRWIDDVLAPEY